MLNIWDSTGTNLNICNLLVKYGQIKYDYIPYSHLKCRYSDDGMRLLYKTTVRGRNVSYVTTFNFVGDSRAKCCGGRKNYRMKGRESDIDGTSKFLVILRFSFLLVTSYDCN